jgi:hypothetical protein
MQDIEDFLYLETDLIDERRYQEWFHLFAAECAIGYRSAKMLPFMTMIMTLPPRMTLAGLTMTRRHFPNGSSSSYRRSLGGRVAHAGLTTDLKYPARGYAECC